MTPIAQVGHVLWKDLREHRVRVALFAGLVLIAMARALGAPVPVDANVLAILVLLGGIAIVGAPVDSDPPADTRSFWAPQPLAPGAVLAAKLAFALLLVLAAALAQAVGLWSLDLRTPRAILYVTGPAQLFGLVLLATLVVTAASTDVRARLLLVFTLLLGFIIAAAKLVTADPVSPAVKAWAAAGTAMLMIAALVAFYRSRRSGRTPFAIALVVLALGGLAASIRTVPTPVPPAGADVPRAEIRLAIPPDAPVVRRGHLRIRLSAVQPAAGWQYSVREPALAVTLGSGRVIRLTTDRNLMNLGGDPGPMPAPSALDALRGVAEPAAWRDLSIPVSQSLQVADGDTIRQVTLTGSVLVTALRVVDTLSVTAGASHARNGVRSTIDSVTMVDGRPEIVVRSEGLIKPEHQSRMFPFTSDFGRAYALLGNAGQRVPMQQTWTASSSGGLVLPSGAFGGATMRLMPVEGAMAGKRGALRDPDARWMQDARLLVIEPRVQGQYPVTLAWTRGGSAPGRVPTAPR